MKLSLKGYNHDRVRLDYILKHRLEEHHVIDLEDIQLAPRDVPDKQRGKSNG